MPLKEARITAGYQRAGRWDPALDGGTVDSCK